MKNSTLIVAILIFTLSTLAAPKARKIELSMGADSTVQTPQKIKGLVILKSPKSLFLLKRAKIDSAVGEPNFYPLESQLRIMTNEKKIYAP